MRSRNIIWIGLCLLLLAACGNNEETAAAKHNTDEEINSQREKEHYASQEMEENEAEGMEGEEHAVSASYTTEVETESVSAENEATAEIEKNSDSLASYTSEEIEYARIWLQLGDNQNVEELNVRHITKGEPLNPNAESSATYPEDVIQLTGARLIDGSITYSGNGDGTINRYYVPLRWEKNTPDDFNEEDMKIFTESLITTTKLISIDPTEGEEVTSLIEKINNES